MAVMEETTSFEEYLKEYGTKKGSLIPLLQAAQEEYSYIPDEAVKKIAVATNKSKSDIYGVVTFYKQFRLTPMGKYVIKICDGTACHVNGSGDLITIIEDELGIEQDGTTEDGMFTFMTVACLGCCSLAPVMMINDDTYGNLDAKKVKKILRDYKKGKYEKKES
jgi:NADH-quinone oxidoreductase subunit E